MFSFLSLSYLLPRLSSSLRPASLILLPKSTLAFPRSASRHLPGICSFLPPFPLFLLPILVLPFLFPISFFSPSYLLFPLVLLPTFCFPYSVSNNLIERPDQGHLYPLGEPRDTNNDSRRRELYLKSYLDSLLLAIRNLYLGRNGRPPQGSPSACVYMDSTGCKPNSPCKALGFIPFQGPRLHTLQVRVFSNHVGVTTVKRPDQGHLYPLGEPRDTCHSRGANLRPPAPQARTLPKELSRQLIAIRNLYLGRNGRPPQSLPIPFWILPPN
jgi:hypothetical protein